MNLRIQQSETKVPGGKPKVFLAVDLRDYKYIADLTNRVLNAYECACYIDTDAEHGFEINPDQEMLQARASELDQMNLIVVLVTRNFLNAGGLSARFDLPYALSDDHHHQPIPVLPIIVAPELEQTFDQAFGNLHAVQAYAPDFEQKLRAALESQFDNYIPIGKKSSAPIPFLAQAFLSYRKKDLAHALKLLERIHSLAAFRNLAIWYDDFLTTGEDYNKNIDKSLQESDIFLLCITPNMFEPGNYVITTEIPAAILAHKQILPIVMSQVTPGRLDEFYWAAAENAANVIGDDPRNYASWVEEMKSITIDGYDTGALAAVLHHYVPAVLRAKDPAARPVYYQDLAPYDKYRLGTCFLNASHMEKNIRFGIQILYDAAEHEDTAALYNLGNYLLEGRYLKQDKELAFQFFETSFGMDYQKYETITPEQYDDPDAVMDFVSLAKIAWKIMLLASEREDRETEIHYLQIYGRLAEAAQKGGFTSAQVNVGLAELGLGESYLDQKDYQEALSHLTPAASFFATMYQANEDDYWGLNFAKALADQGLAYTEIGNQHVKPYQESRGQVRALYNLARQQGGLTAEQASLLNKHKQALERHKIPMAQAHNKACPDLVDAIKFMSKINRTQGGLKPVLHKLLMNLFLIASLNEDNQNFKGDARELYKFVFDQYCLLDQEGPDLEIKFYLAQAAINLAVCKVEVPDPDLLKIAGEYIDTCAELAPDRADIKNTQAMIHAAIEAWPKNIL